MSLNTLQKIIKYCLYITAFVPLLVIRNSIFPFVVPKVALFQLLVETIFFIWVVLLWQSKELRAKIRSILKSWLFWGITLFVVSLFVSSFFGVNFYKSFWGNYERMFGLFAILHFYLFFIVLYSIFSKKDFERFFQLSIISACLVVIYGFAQVLLKVSFTGAVKGWRMESTIGNSAILATYLLFNLFFAAFLSIRDFLHDQNNLLPEQGRSPSRRLAGVLYFSAATVLFLGIIFTATRGAWLGLGIGFLIFAAGALLAKPRNFSPLSEKSVKFLKIGILAVLLFGAILWSFLYLNKEKSFVANNPVFARAVAVSLQDVTTKTRLIAWQMSLKAVKEKPVFGWGWENYNVAFDKYYDVNLYPTENWFDRAHNFYLDILSMSGAVGLAGYILFLLAFFFVLFKAYRKKELHYLEFILVVSFFIAYLVQNFVLFDTPVSFLVLFVFLAYAAVMEGSPEDLKETKNAVAISYVPLVLALVLFLIVSYQAVYRPFAAGALTSLAAGEENQNVEKIKSDFEKAFSYNSFGKIEIMEQLVNKTEKMEVLEYEEENIGKYREFVLNFAASKAEEISSQPKSGLRERFNLLRIYWIAGFFNNDYYREGEEIGDKVLEEFPTKVLLYAFVGRFKLKNHNTEGALQMYEKLLAVNPNAPESHWDLGLAYLENDIFGEADFEIRQALDTGYDPTEEQLLYVAQNFAVKNQFLWALPYYEKLVKINSEVPRYWLALAILYKEVNFIPEARDAIAKFVNLDPTQKPLTDQFLKELK